MPGTQAVLRQFCAVCGQWLVSVRSIKLHYKQVHPEAYDRYSEKAAADCKKIGHLISPCTFCGYAMKRTDLHSGTCPVLWQARMCCLLKAAPCSSELLCQHDPWPTATGLR